MLSLAVVGLVGVWVGWYGLALALVWLLVGVVLLLCFMGGIAKEVSTMLKFC